MTTMTADNNQRFHPLKFALYVGIASMVMLFAAFTSAYIVRKSQGEWLLFRLPLVFWINTAVISSSSVTARLATRAFKKYDYRRYKILLSVTFLLGVLFLLGQFAGWNQLKAGGILLSGNPSGSFVYVISYTHAAHIGGGLLIMLITLLVALFKPFDPNKLVKVEILETYWHFVDFLWIYLFIFFQVNLF